MQTEFFEIDPLSKTWPSTNPDDRPGYKYICKLCDKEIIIPEHSLLKPDAANKHVNSHYLRYKGEIE